MCILNMLPKWEHLLKISTDTTATKLLLPTYLYVYARKMYVYIMNLTILNALFVWTSTRKMDGEVIYYRNK